MQRHGSQAAQRASQASLLTLGLLVASCSPDRPRVEPEIPSGFEIGPVSDYPISATGETAIEDTTTGVTFVLPSGGEGTLSVARVLSSPVPEPDGADGFLVEFNADDRIHIRMPREGNVEPLLWVCATPATSTFEPRPQAEAWIPVMPTDTLSNPAVFEIYEAGGIPDFAPGLAAVAARPAQSYFFMRKYIPKEGSEWLNFLNIRVITEWTIRDVIAALPTASASFARQETQGRLALRAWIALPSPQISSYNAFEWWARGAYRRLYPRFNFVATGHTRATESTVAHEVGHYFTHVFLGDDGFAQISEQLRESHQFGTVNPERPMLEEYAQYVDYFKNGTVGGRMPVEDPIRALRIANEGVKPADVDWPAQEGFATCLLARLHAEGGTVTGLSAISEEIPTIGMSHGEVLELLFTSKPLTVNQLRGAIALSLAGRSQEDRLPPLLERTGWSYHGHGIIHDTQGKPIKGAWIRNVHRVANENGKAYYAPLAPVETGADGRFDLIRIFPGKTTLQVTVDDKTVEFPIQVDANGPTTKDLDLGTFTVRESALDALRTMTWMHVRCEGEFALDNGAMEVRLLVTGSNRDHPAVWTGSELVWDYSDSSAFGESIYGQSVHCEASFSDDGRTLLRLKAHHYEWQTFKGKLAHTRTADLDIDDLTMTVLETQVPGSRAAYFARSGAEISPRVRSISFVERYLDQYNITITAVGFNWTGSTMSGMVEVSLRDHSD